MGVQLDERRVVQDLIVQIYAATFGADRIVQEASIAARLIAQEFLWQLKVERVIESSLGANRDVPAVAREHVEAIVNLNLAALTMNLIVPDVGYNDAMQVIPVAVGICDVVNCDIPWAHESCLTPNQWVLLALL